MFDPGMFESKKKQELEITFSTMTTFLQQDLIRSILDASKILVNQPVLNTYILGPMYEFQTKKLSKKGIKRDKVYLIYIDYDLDCDIYGDYNKLRVYISRTVKNGLFCKTTYFDIPTNWITLFRDQSIDWETKHVPFLENYIKNNARGFPSTFMKNEFEIKPLQYMQRINDSKSL